MPRYRHSGCMADVRVGGQALPDGVLMRTERAWAVARADGSIEVGQLQPAPLANVPIVRVLTGLGRGLALGFKKLGQRRRGNASGRRFIAVLIVATVLTSFLPQTGSATVNQVLVMAVTLLVLRFLTPAALWRYHGAEHKAVAAHEAGVDLADVNAVLSCDRVHNRCGTNLVVVFAVAMGLVVRAPGAVQVPLAIFAFAGTAELLSLAAKHPGNVLAKAFLISGRAVQRYLTTTEPDAAEQAVGCRALRACLVEHDRVVAADPAPVLAAA